MADEQVGQAELAAQRVEEAEHGRLHGEVEAGGGLVEDDDARVQHEDAGEADAALLAARELVRIAAAEGGIEADGGEDGVDAPGALGAVADAVDAQRLVERMADAPPGIERGAGVLVHVLHGAADAARLARLEPRDDRAVEADGAGGLAHEAERRAGERGLAAAELADQAQRLPGLERERDAVDGAHLGARLAEERAAAAEHGDDVVERQDGLGAGHHARAPLAP